MHRGMELRKAPTASLDRIAEILDYESAWKIVMAAIPKRLTPHRTGLVEPRYNSDNMRSIERHAQENNVKCAKVLFDEWSTTGRERPTLHSLMKVLVEAEMFRAADELAMQMNGENNLSTEMAATIDDAAVVSRLSNETNFLAVKLKSGTVNYTHFAQIYQFVPVPSLFFIGRNGTPLEVVCAGVQPDNLASRIDRILAEHHREKPPIQPSTSGQSVKEQTTSLLQSEAAGVAREVQEAPKPTENTSRKSETEPSSPPAKIAKTESSPPSPSPGYEMVCDGDVCVRRPKEGGASTSAQEPAATAPAAPNLPTAEAPAAGPSAEATTSTGSIDDKTDRAKELIEARRREKAEKEKELERQKELERRNTGQGVAELKRWQTEQELKQIQEERKREKMENNLARQRILEQIAQDRAERRARDVPAAQPQSQPAATVTQATPQANATSGDAHSSARIQFKLPDGSSHSASFAATGTLGEVQRYVADNLQLSSSNFALWTAFPRRELTETEWTLRELRLAPSAALLVLPRRAPAAPPQGSSFSVIAFISQLLTSLIYEPSLQLYTWLRTRLFPPPAVSPSTPTPTAPRAPTPAAPTLRRRGNIHRLPGDAPDDDNNTWNGNSTQQM